MSVCLHLCLYVCLPLELQVAVISHVGAGNQTWSPSRTAKCFQLVSCLFCPRAQGFAAMSVSGKGSLVPKSFSEGKILIASRFSLPWKSQEKERC